MFGPRQVGEMIVGNAVATETTVKAFLTGASDKEVGVFSADGTAVAAGKPFYFLQKTGADEAIGGFEFCDRIDPRYINKITVRKYEPEVLGKYTVSGFTGAGFAAPMRTYQIAIRVENELSPENFEVITGYYVTGEVLGATTAATIKDGLVKSLNSNLTRRGGNEFEVAAVGDTIVVTEKYQDNTPGKKDGRKLRFKVTAAVYNNVSNGINSNLGLLTVAQTVAPSFGSGTGKWATEYEYFVSGYKYDPNRTFAYPLDFNTPYYTSKKGAYNVIQIMYYTPRTETSVENQHKVLTIAVDEGTAVAVVNAVLAKLRTAVGTFATVPANLSAPAS